MADSTRLHLGAGRYRWPGWENLDSETDLRDLPYADGSVKEIYGIHLFEHLPRLEVDSYLNEWFRVLQTGGKLVLELPCLDKIAEMIVSGEKDLRLTLMGLFGDPREYADNPLMRHEWAWTVAEITKFLEGSGFHVEVKEPFYHHKARDMRVIGRK